MFTMNCSNRKKNHPKWQITKSHPVKAPKHTTNPTHRQKKKTPSWYLASKTRFHSPIQNLQHLEVGTLWSTHYASLAFWTNKPDRLQLLKALKGSLWSNRQFQLDNGHSSSKWEAHGLLYLQHFLHVLNKIPKPIRSIPNTQRKPQIGG